ncbi:MAG: DUF1926 domain-containing protein [Candidatus Eisenbacteria bacterium]|nr:DUF1926 domain-containing protein [Candidatus Eisenbacteria bacterium]
MNTISLVLCIHNHQPVGNLPDVFRHAYEHAYLPFLEAVEEFPEIRFVFHNTGPLLEWYEENAPEYIERLRALVERGQVEILSGAFYEPILPVIPRRDTAGQIAMMTRYVEEVFGTRPRGMWLAERVWEPHLAGILGGAGIEYLPLDDYQFRLSGLPQEDLTGYFVTDDDGVPVRLFPILKSLRYTIPFQDPGKTLDVLRGIAERGRGLLAVFGDDGEKFGVWPGTHGHVYGDGWLRKFLSTIRDNSDWIETTTFADFVDTHRPAGKVYLPAASYPEMMEWALPTDARKTYSRMQKQLQDEGRFDEWGPFLSGGAWRGFVSKYRESNLMVRKMMRVSAKVEGAARTIERLRESGDLNDVAREQGAGREPAVDPESLGPARRELWRGQCNCAYWHGVFGGLYLPHLRSAVYEHLIAAENLVDQIPGSLLSRLEIVDHDLDGEREVVLETHWANAYVWPARGGVLQEFDLRSARWNVLGTMSRYVEAYHEDAVRPPDEAPNGDVASIHDPMGPREEGLERFVRRDQLPRGAAVDRFLPSGTNRDALLAGEARCLGDFGDGRYEEWSPSRAEGSVGVTMRRVGRVGESDVRVTKKISIESGRLLRVDYGIRPRGALDVDFASEWNLAFLTGSKEYVRFGLPDGTEFAGDARRTLKNVSALSFTDDLRGATLELSFDPPCAVWIYPLETASQSEGGLERVFQGATVTAVWSLDLGDGNNGEYSIALREPDTREGHGD